MQTQLFLSLPLLVLFFAVFPVEAPAARRTEMSIIPLTYQHVIIRNISEISQTVKIELKGEGGRTLAPTGASVHFRSAPVFCDAATATCSNTNTPAGESIAPHTSRSFSIETGGCWVTADCAITAKVTVTEDMGAIEGSVESYNGTDGIWSSKLFNAGRPF